MGLFSRKSSPVREASLTSWLQEADAAYNYACQTHTLQNIPKFFDGEAANYILSLVRSNQKEYQGLNRYRHVNFKLITSNDSILEFKKDVSYDNIKIQFGASIAVGDAYTEIWTIRNDTSKKVFKIRRATV